MTRFLKLFIALGFAALLSACDEPVSSGALTFFGECISDVPSDCMSVTPLGSGQPYVVNREPIVEPHHFADAEVENVSYHDTPVIAFTLTDEGQVRFSSATKALIGKVIVMVDEDRFVSAPYVREPLFGRLGQVVGRFTPTEAEDLVARILANRQPLAD